MSQIVKLENKLNNPIDVVESVAENNDWIYERNQQDELCIQIKGTWCDYAVSFSWIQEQETIHLACSFDMKVKEGRLQEVLWLMSLINEQMLIGHFDIWIKDGSVMFRHAFPLNGGATVNEPQIEFLLSSALVACERYYQAFQYVIWADHKSQDALDNVLFDTVGEA